MALGVMNRPSSSPRRPHTKTFSFGPVVDPMHPPKAVKTAAPIANGIKQIKPELDFKASYPKVKGLFDNHGLNRELLDRFSRPAI